MGEGEPIETAHDDAEPAKVEGGQGSARGAAATARDAGRHLADGYAAVRDVRKASRRHSGARAEARALRAELAKDEEELRRRDELEGDYERIVAAQTQALEAARAEETTARDRAETLDAERATLKAQLSALKERNEERLRPYRNLADATKRRSDDAAVALAEARRAVKVADGRMAEAVRGRDQRVQTASRAIDSAQGRLHKAQGELDRLGADASASPSVLDRMRAEVEAARSSVDAARADVAQASDEAQLAVDNAQTHLWTQRQSLEVAQQQADAAKADAKASRDEYDALYRQAKAEEDGLADDIRERERAIEAARADAKAAAGRVEAARALLDEANEVHATPEVTSALRRKVASGQVELDRRDQEVAELARRARGLRKRTRTLRVAFFVAVVLAVALVAIVAWTLVGR